MDFKITKKKIGVIALVGAITTTLGTAVVFASEDTKEMLLSKMQDGVRTYSTDDGQTWSEKAPDNIILTEEDGKVTIVNAKANEQTGEGGSLCRVENGVRKYSIDGGKTWIENAPEGSTVIEDGNKTTIKFDN